MLVKQFTVLETKGDPWDHYVKTAGVWAGKKWSHSVAPGAEFNLSPITQGRFGVRCGLLGADLPGDMEYLLSGGPPRTFVLNETFVHSDSQKQIPAPVYLYITRWYFVITSLFNWIVSRPTVCSMLNCLIIEVFIFRQRMSIGNLNKKKEIIYSLILIKTTK